MSSEAYAAENERLRGWLELIIGSRDPHAAYCARHALAGDPVPLDTRTEEKIWR